jgi:hypothetical protein
MSSRAMLASVSGSPFVREDQLGADRRRSEGSGILSPTVTYEPPFGLGHTVANNHLDMGRVKRSVDRERTRLRPRVQLADRVLRLRLRQVGPTLVAQKVNTRAISATNTMAIAMSHSRRTTTRA